MWKPARRRLKLQDEEDVLAIEDDLRAAVTAALSAGIAAARKQGSALGADFESLVKPNLDAIVVRIAAIAEDRVIGTIDDDQAREDISSQLDTVRPIILAAGELALLAVQTIVNAVLDALKAALNTATTHAIGIALL